MDGKYLLVIFTIKNKRLVLLSIRKTGKFEVRWTAWASSTRLLVSLGFSAWRGAVPTYETRLLAMNYDGSKTVEMAKQKSGQVMMQIKDRIVDMLPQDPDHILMAYRTRGDRTPRVEKVNIFTGKGHHVQRGMKNVQGWITDRSGEVRVGYGLQDKRYRYLVCDSGGNNWRVLSSIEINSKKSFRVRGFSSDPNILIVGSNHEGPTMALYAYNVKENRFTQKIFGHPEVDISHVGWDKRTWTPRFVRYYLDGVKYHWLDKKAEDEVENVKKALPGMHVQIMETSEDDSIWLLKACSATNPGGYYMFTRKTRKVEYFGPNYPELVEAKLSRMFRFKYLARDGLKISAYLTLASHIDETKQNLKLPMVVMPHGGPACRDYLAFDPIVQFMSNRGYAVLQINFRGSSGYGKAFEVAGYGEWGGKMQDDVTDGVQFMLDKGIADPHRIGIVGGSYGGYAALMGVVKTPDLYQCAVGFNGVYNLKKLVKDKMWYIGRGRVLRTMIGNYSDKSISPTNRAGEILCPVLLAVASDDRVIRSSQSKKMSKALQRSGRECKFLEFKDGGHGLETYESRLGFMKALESFLVKHLK
ncbi:MAG: S9 family peptidase [Deltaproteobacteria bacterium]|nr:S9 family peptidase [Deltaproteobacteria bacterium]